MMVVRMSIFSANKNPKENLGVLSIIEGGELVSPPLYLVRNGSNPVAVLEDLSHFCDTQGYDCVQMQTSKISSYALSKLKREFTKTS